MKRFFKSGAGRYEKIREKFPKTSSCNVVFGIFLQNATFQTKISNMGYISRVYLV